MSTNTIFQKLGLVVVSEDKGVYQLRPLEEHGDRKSDLVGLLFSATPLDKQPAHIQLFLQESSAEVPAARIVYHWQTLDARRFAESGLEPRELEVSADRIPERANVKNFTRPDGVRMRHAVTLTTGEVVCYN
jgi:hypothetical protein